MLLLVSVPKDKFASSVVFIHYHVMVILRSKFTLGVTAIISPTALYLLFRIDFQSQNERVY